MRNILKTHSRDNPARLISTALVIIVLDQVVKRAVVSTMRFGESIDVLGSFARFTRTSNTGAAFGMLRGKSYLFIIISALASAAIVLFSREIAKMRRVEQTAFGLVLGGAVGNLIDRIRLGAVIDFIDLGIGGARFAAFNVADSAITIGVVLLAFHLIFMPRHDSATAETVQEHEGQ